MSGNFLKFKRRLCLIRALRGGFVGLTAGLVSAGVWLILTRLALIESESIYSLYIGIGVAFAVGGLLFLFTRKSDKAFAEELDAKFGLKARVQTMIAYRDEEGALYSMQREDSDSALAAIPLSSYKFKRLWVYIVALMIGAAVLVTGFILPDMRNYVPPEEIEPFELTDFQRKGLEEIIGDVEKSAMENEFRLPMVEELRLLLSELEAAKTMPEAQASLAKSMAMICDITYRSSTATEMLNALWDSDDIYLRYLAKTLDTSSWTSPDWGDFGEKMVEYARILMGDDNEGEDALRGTASLKWAIDSMVRKLDMAASSSGLDSSDEIYAAIERLFNSNPGGLKQLLAKIDGYDEDKAREELMSCLDFNKQALYDAISLNRINAYTGEKALTRLSALFAIPAPEPERPEFVKTGESVDGNQGSGSDKENENGNNDGGIGEGATFGSDDLVLDPLTGKYVKYGDLIHYYHGLMDEKLKAGSYTEEQQEAIRKYFSLLFNKIEKEEEGN